ncbi:MAG: arylamine N-acetyltransferase [Pseudomonadota bacterium]
MTDDLAAYLARIGIAGPVAPDRATLARIVAAHTASIPFEGIDGMLGTPVVLDHEVLMAKLVHGQRGGFCFEQNRLLAAMLEEIGFAVTALGARVLWNAPPDAVTPLTHMLLRVDLAEGPVIVDAGFGGNTPTGPLALIADRAQATPHEQYRLTRAGDYWVQAVSIGGEWRPTYRFTLEPQHRADHELGSWYMSTNPRSHFVFGLTCALALPDRRLALRNFDFAVHHLGGETERRQLADAAAVCDVVEKEIGIRLPDRDAFVRRVEQGIA